MPNHLDGQTSPYLRQHASDPIDWFPWGAEAWARAQTERKPVLLSIGYASCHWCHVMQRESYLDPEVAAAVNKDFVAIMVDREERPDLDSHFIEALQTLTGDAGWPMTLFLTPERKMFFGGTYFPPAARDDLPAFIRVLDSVQDQWSYNKREILKQAEDVFRQMQERLLPAEGPPPALTTEALTAALAAVQASADQTYGGFGDAPKFPQPWLVELMLRAAQRGPGGAHGVADVALRRMARGAIHDQLGGGFHRYTADGAWRIPHFEKMLYDNALLARAYTHAWQARRDPAFARVAQETLEYVLTELRSPSGGFQAGQDADLDGVEGRYYLWTRDELLAVPGVSAADADFFGATPAAGTVALTAAGDDVPAEARKLLLAAREERAGGLRPAVDGKILTSWNGLAIAALADAGAAFDRPDLVVAAVAAAGAVLTSGDLVHVVGGPGRAPGLLEDYAYLAEGLLALYSATLDARWAQEAERLARRMLALFADPEGGALFVTDGSEPGLLRRKDLIDGTTPSPNGVAAQVLLRLGSLLGDPSLSGAGEGILQSALPLIAQVPEECGSLLAALDLHLSGGREIAVVGDPAAPATRALLRRIWDRYLPNHVLAGGSLASPLLTGREEAGGRPAAYVCEHHACRRPTSDPAELARQLRTPGQPTPEQVNRAAQLSGFTLHNISLYTGLDNPRWITPLAERGVFADPPAPIEHYVSGGTGSAPWPAAKYLARMAAVDPFAVHQVVMAVPDSGNSLIHEDLADAALAMPPDLAAGIALRAREWLTSTPHQVMLPKKMGELVSHLAKGRQGAAALEVARSLLDLLAEPVREARGLAGTEGFVSPPQPAGRFAVWDYEHILQENIPDLVRAVQQPALDLLAGLLERALDLSLPEGAPGAGEGEAGIEDGSYLWRPAVGDDNRNVDRSLRNALVTAVRDAAGMIAQENPGIMAGLVPALEARRWRVFRRLALHLLAAFPDDVPALVDDRLADRGLLADPHTSREWLLLARARWGALGGDRREEILAWVREGPELARWDATPDRWAVDPKDEIEAAEYRREWSAARRAFLTGPPDGADDDAFAFPLSDPPLDLGTPKQAEWLREAPVAALAAFTQAWRPPLLLGAPTLAGLARKLAEVATAEPAHFADQAADLAGLPDDELRAVVVGLREAARQGATFDWAPLVASFAAAGERGLALRESMAQCLAQGLNPGDTEVPFALRDDVWGVLEPVARESAEGLQAVARYALWVRRHGPRSSARQGGWEDMPEVRAVLEAHLAVPPAERALAVQAFFGQWFPWLLMLDARWAVAQRDAIFPPEPELAELRRVAWDTYLGKTPPFDGVFVLLADAYAAGAGEVVEGDGLTRPQQGLAEHLMALYLRGRVPLSLQEGVLADFFAEAHPWQRAHAMAWVGQTLQTQEGRVPGEILARLMRLWEARLSAARAAGEEGLGDYLEELMPFGVWYASGKFEEDWAVQQLAALLALTGRVGNTPKVVERLKASMETRPYEVVRCIATLVAAERDKVTILGWGKDAQQILSRIVGGSHAEARGMALDLLDTFDLAPVTELIRWS